MKKTLVILSILLGVSISSQANPQWGFTLGNGAGFYWGGSNGRQQGNNFYQQNDCVRVSPVVYYPNNTYYVQTPVYYVSPQPQYMQPYQNFQYRRCR